MSHMIPFHIGYGTGRSSVWVQVSDNCIVSAADFQLTSTLYTFYLFLIAAIHIGGRCLGFSQLDTPELWRTMWNPKTPRQVGKHLSLCLQYPSSCPWAQKVPRLRSTPSRQHCQPTWHCTLPMAPIRTMIVTRFNHWLCLILMRPAELAQEKYSEKYIEGWVYLVCMNMISSDKSWWCSYCYYHLCYSVGCLNMILPWLRGQDMKSQLQPLESSGSGRLPLNVPWWSGGGVGCWKFTFDIIWCLLIVNMLTICLSLIIIAWYGDPQYLAVLGYLYWSYMCRVGWRKVENTPSVATFWDLCLKGCLQLICWSFGPLVQLFGNGDS